MWRITSSLAEVELRALQGNETTQTTEEKAALTREKARVLTIRPPGSAMVLVIH